MPVGLADSVQDAAGGHLPHDCRHAAVEGGGWGEEMGVELGCIKEREERK